MNAIENIYSYIHRMLSKPQERGEYSAGRWQNKVRAEALNFSKDLKGRLLEVGCGEGLFLTELALLNKEIEIYGIDKWPEILKRAEERFENAGLKKVKLIHADAVSMPFEDSYFDTVVCVNVIFNLPSKDIVKKALREISRVCKKNAKVILDFRNRKNPLLYLKYKLAPYYDETVKNLPLRTYSLKEICLLAQESGFEVENRIAAGSVMHIFKPIIILNLKKNN